MIVFNLKFQHQTIVYVKGTSSKMASTLCQKWFTTFLSKSSKILYSSDHTMLFKFHQHVVQMLININGNIKCPIGKSIFAVNWPLNRFRATIANTDIESQKYLHTFLTKCLYHMLVKFEHIRIVPTTRNFELFDKKSGFLKSFLTKRWRHFGRRFWSWINYLLLNY